MRSASTLLGLPLVLLALGGAPFLCVGVWEARETSLRLETHSVASATVMGNRYLEHTDPEDSSRSSGAFHPEVRFSTERGERVVFTDGVGTYPAKYEVGDSVEVLYDPDHPDDALIRSWSNLWGASMIFIFVGLIPMIAAVALWVTLRAAPLARRRREA